MILCWISSVLRRPQKKRPFQPDPKEEPCSNKCWRLDPQLKLEAASFSLAQPVGPVESAAPQADATASAQPPALHAIMALDSSSTAKGAASPAKGATSPGKDTKSLAKDTAAAAAAAAARNSLKAQDSAAAGTSFDPAADGGGRMEAGKSSGASVAATGDGKGDAGGSRGGAAESAPAAPAKAPQQPSAGALLLSGSL